MYLNEAQVSLTGYVATQPVVRTVKSGATNMSMRVAWTPRRQDRVTGEWTDGNTSYVTVICWRRLATNGAVCLRKGDPVVVKGRLSIRNYEDKQGMQRVAVEVEASSVGHDLSRGVAQFQRVRPQTGMTAAEFAAANANGAGSQGGQGGASAASSSDVVSNDLESGGLESGGLESGGLESGGLGHGDLASSGELPPSAELEQEDPFFNEAALMDRAAEPEQVATPF